MVTPTFNTSIFQALIGLRSTNATIDQAAERVSTGLRVNSVDDDVQTFVRGINISNSESAFTSRQNAAKTARVPLDAAISTLESVLSTLSTMRKNLTDTLANSDFSTGSSIHLALEVSFTGIVTGSNVDGNDLLSSTTTVVTLFVDGGAGDVSVTGTSFGVLATNAGGAFAAVATAADANSEIAKVDVDVAAITGYLGTLSAARAAITAIQDASSTASLKSSELQNQLLSADLERESATLTAAQTQRDVALTAIGIVSASQRSVLSIFR